MKNNSCILVGSGTSVLEGIELGLWDKIKDEEIWSLNYAFKTMLYLPIKEVWIDKAFFLYNTNTLQNLYKQGVKLLTASNSQYKFFPEITTYNTSRNRCDYSGKEMINKNKVFVGTMGQCGFFALSLALCMGFNPIYLLGFDFGTPHYGLVNTHFYQDKATSLGIISKGMGKKDVYYNDKGQLKEGINDYELYTQENVRIYNVSQISNIKCFPKITYPAFFQLLKGKNE